MPLGVSLSDGLGSTVWTLKVRDGCGAAKMPCILPGDNKNLGARQGFAAFPPPLPKVRKRRDIGTAVGTRTDIHHAVAVHSNCRPRSAAVGLE